MKNIELSILLKNISKIHVLKRRSYPSINPMNQFEIHKTILQKEEVEELCRYLNVDQNPSASLRTTSKYKFDLVSPDKTIHIGYLGSGVIRWLDQMGGLDYKLIAPALLINWLESIGLSDPDKWEEEAQEKRRQKSQTEAEISLRALPDMLKTKNGGIKPEYLQLSPFPHYEELCQVYPDENEMLLSLLPLLVDDSEKISWEVKSEVHQLIISILLETSIERIGMLITAELDPITKEAIAKLLTSKQFQKVNLQKLDQLEVEKKKIIMKYLQRQGVGPKIRAFRKLVMT